jgi:hypothetical protein
MTFDLFRHLSQRERIKSDPTLVRIWDRKPLEDAVTQARIRYRAEIAKLEIFDKLGEKK